MQSRYIQTRQHARVALPSELFMPRARGEAPDPTRLELSTFETTGLIEAEIWKHGWVHFLKPPRRLHGRADFPATTAAVLTAVRDSGLPPVVSQIIPYTDFPLDEVEIWSSWDGRFWTLYLPSEH